MQDIPNIDPDHIIRYCEAESELNKTMKSDLDQMIKQVKKAAGDVGLCLKNTMTMRVSRTMERREVLERMDHRLETVARTPRMSLPISFAAMGSQT